MTVENPFSTVRKLLSAQVLMAVVVVALFSLTAGLRSALSPLLGAVVAIVPNLYFAYQVYLARYQQAQGILSAFYKGETVKMILTVALFAIVLQVPSVNFLTLLLGYIAVLSVFWFALFYWRD